MLQFLVKHSDSAEEHVQRYVGFTYYLAEMRQKPNERIVFAVFDGNPEIWLVDVATKCWLPEMRRYYQDHYRRQPERIVLLREDAIY